MAVRMKSAEFEMLRKVMAGEKVSAPEARPRKPKSSLPENMVESQIVDFLRARRWVVRRQHVGKHVPLGYLLRMMARGPLTKAVLFQAIVDVGEKHAADWRAERSAGGGLMQVLYIEVKARGEKPEEGQLLRLEQYRLTGALAGWFDRIDAFEVFYFNHVKDLR